MIELCGSPVGSGERLFVIAGPDVIESEEMVLRHAQRVKEICIRHQLPFAFKCSYDKANRTSGKSFRGPGLTEGMRILERVKKECKVPLLTDVHDVSQVAAVSQVADVLQVPAFLCRQTDLVRAAAKSGKGVNIKKGQFVAPADMLHIANKAFEVGNPNVLVTDRGFCFGYNNLVVDMRGLLLMREAGLSVCFDATHSVQLPMAGTDSSAGERKFVSLLARAATAAGLDALFMEVHENPEQALCDGPCSLDFFQFEQLLKEVIAIRQALAHERQK